jgi:hypothetical protein
MKGWNKSGLDYFNNYYKFWRFGINPGLFQQKRTGSKSKEEKEITIMVKLLEKTLNI